MGCALGCSFSNKNYDNGLITTKIIRIEDLKDLKITEGMLIQESKESPFNTYEEIRELGEGSFGKVYLCKHKISGVERAIKCIIKEKAKMNEEDEKKLIKEINIIKTLDHPNIMKVYEYFDEEETLSIVSELCTGGELFEKIKNKNNFTEKESLYVMRQLLSAVAFCHKNRIVHRDLKPENILIENEEEYSNEFYTIKIIDFGTSQKIRRGQINKGIIGTPFYIAPEVLKNNYDEKCDLWSCGIILYIMLCGDPPFYGDSDEQIYNNILKSKPNFEENEIWKSVSENAKDLIKKLLIKDYNKRLSAVESLQHPWIQSFNLSKEINKNPISDSVLLKIVNNMHKYKATGKLQQASIAYIVHNLISKEKIKDLRKCFVLFDLNGDGRLDKIELISGLKKINNENISEDELETEVNRVMKIIDVDGNGFIEYEEFLRATLDKNEILTEKNMKTVFRIFDTNNSGKITPSKLKNVLGQSGNIINDRVWTAIVNDLDHNHQGFISYIEFVRMLEDIKDDRNNNKIF